MDDDVCAQVPAPCGQRSKQDSKHADHDHILPTLIEVKETEHNSLSQYGCRKASGQRMKLLLHITPECHFLANASGDRGSNPGLCAAAVSCADRKPCDSR